MQYSIGANVTLYKRCTIGELQKEDGEVSLLKKGVVIYVTATMCGNIHVEVNSIIEPGAFVDFYVPENAIVIGKHGTIYREVAKGTEKTE